MLRFAIFASWLAVLASPLTAADLQRPNVLIIMADDCTFRDLPIYGGENAVTPHLDRLAEQGLVFDRAYLASAMCQPCRAELYTGQYPMRNGCAWNHSASHPETLSMPHHLGRLGYRVGLTGKVHVSPAEAFPFEEVGGFDPSCVRDPTEQHSLDACREFMLRNPVEPFCLVVALVEPHVPWVMGDASAYPLDRLKLPPNMADTPITRDAFARYLAEITYMDGQVGEIVALLQDLDRHDNTLVLFTSEQGAQFPGCKWTNWDTGLHTGLIARWPGKVAAGKRTSALVQYADVLPTLLELAGDDSGLGDFDGESFASVLLGNANSHRKYVYGTHNNVPEGPPYPIRTVSDGNYRYIRNLTPDNLFIEKHLMGIRGDGKLNNRYWQSWIWDSWESPRTYALVQRYMKRPAESLFHTASDPYELQDLIGSDATQSIERELRNELDRWLVSQGDPGVEQDTQRSLRAAKRGEHRFRPPTDTP